MKTYYSDYPIIDAMQAKRLKSAKRRKRACIIAITFAIIMGSFSIGLNMGTNSSNDLVTMQEVESLIATALQDVQDQNHQAISNAQAQNHQAISTMLDSAANTLATAAEHAQNAYNNAADMFKAIDDAVVSIIVVQQQRTLFGVQEMTSAGSGVIFEEGPSHIYIATNYHVIAGADHVSISLDDINTAPASFVGGDERSDLAVISVLRQDLAGAGIDNYILAEFGDSDDMQIGNFVLAVGNAYGEGKSATLGIVSALDKNITLEGGINLNVLQTDAAINPGNSGGPLVNTLGQVIGINTARFGSPRSQGMGYAIPSNDAMRVLNSIMTNGNVHRPILGIINVTLTPELQSQHNLSATGVYIQEVLEDFAADQMGLMAGDIITHFNGNRINDARQMSDHIMSTPIGGHFTLTVMRGTQELTLSGNMTSRPASDTNF